MVFGSAILSGYFCVNTIEKGSVVEYNNQYKKLLHKNRCYTIAKFSMKAKGFLNISD